MRKPHQINWFRLLEKITKSFLLALVVLLSFQAVFFSWFANPYDYIEYSAVEATKEVYIIGEENLFFRSFAETKKQHSYKWADNLQCDIVGDGFGGGYFSQSMSEQVNIAPSIRDGSSIWRYEEALPLQNADCKLRSTTFVVFEIFLVFSLDRPLAPIYSQNIIKFRRKTE